MQKPQLLIFDWDGTLLDSAAFIVSCVQSAARDIGVEVPDASLIRKGIGIPLHAQMYRLFPHANPHDFEAVINRYRHYAITAPQLPQLFPGVVETLIHLHSQNYLLAVATSKFRKGLEREFERHQLIEFFSASRCGDEAEAKPHPQMLLELLTELDLPAERAIMIGDTEYDLQMANNAKIQSIGLSWGVHGKEQLLAQQPLTVIDDIAYLPAWLESCISN